MMIAKRKKYLIIPISILILLSGYWYFFSHKWVTVIHQNSGWQYQFVDDPQELDQTWQSTTSSILLSDKQKKQHLVLQHSFNLTNPSSIQKAEISYDYRYDAEFYINGILCAHVDQHVITSDLKEENPAKIKIVEFWRPRKVQVDKATLQKVLIKGENQIQLVVNFLENIKELSTNNNLVLFHERGNQNNFSPHFKLNRPPKTYSSSTLPIFKINTNDQPIPDEPKTIAQLTISDENKGLNHLNAVNKSFNIKIERRGHIAQTFAKKSYTFKTYDRNNKKLKTPLLGLPESSKWVLYGPYADKSLIRNALTYTLYSQMGHYAPRFRFVDLVINNNFQGIYLLTEKIQIGPEHLNLKPLKIHKKDSLFAEGAYLLEIDRDGWQAPYPPAEDSIAYPLYYNVYKPGSKKLNAWVEQRIKDQYTEFEQHIYNQDNMYDYIDEASFIDYFIITELTKNIDGYRLSTFLYNPDIQAQTPKFYIGPIWDYNFAFGLSSTKNGFESEGFVFNRDRNIPFWWRTLYQDPHFKSKLKERFTYLRTTTLSNDQLIFQIDSLGQICKPAIFNNFSKWTLLGSDDLWPNHFLGKTYQEEIDYLKNWTLKRVEFLDHHLLGSDE